MTASTQNHRRKQLLAGWEQEQLQENSNFKGTAMLPPDQMTMEQQQNNEASKQKWPKRHRLMSLGPLVSIFSCFLV